MRAPWKITCTNLDLHLAIEQGETPDTLAARYGCTPAAIRWRLRQHRRRSTPPPAAPPGPAPPPDAFPGPDAMAAVGDSIATLTALKRACLEQLGAASSHRLSPADQEQLQKVGSLLLATLGQLHHHVALAVKLTERVHNVKYMGEFEEEVLNAVQSVDPETASRIWSAIRQRRARRVALPEGRDTD